MRRALTAADVRTAAAAGRREIDAPRGTIVTALARDTARELGVTLRQQVPTGAPVAPSGSLEQEVRRIVTTVLGAGTAGAVGGPGTGRGVRHVDARDVRLEPFTHPGPEPGQEVRAVDVITAADGAPMAAGFLTLTRGCFPWTLTYDEVQYVIEGELHIGTHDGTVVGRPGDVLYVPKGTAITFGTPSWARFLYVTYPADWEASST
ncbi:cupin domain-containing protein [Actinotalea sp. K2]|uniref:cupin domain-containing protein n=1 Tax=Actinotalea sp. K2 TaxID=2939438 RepID=UPI0020179BC8|nr:cupin domain-containing protein [Actinotalea sp. K2]MCL3859792.1 cupin domain-containing protein [Actinotalea sp. K2]